MTPLHSNAIALKTYRIRSSRDNATTLKTYYMKNMLEYEITRVRVFLYTRRLNFLPDSECCITKPGNGAHRSRQSGVADLVA